MSCVLLGSFCRDFLSKKFCFNFRNKNDNDIRSNCSNSNNNNGNFNNDNNSNNNMMMMKSIIMITKDNVQNKCKADTHVHNNCKADTHAHDLPTSKYMCTVHIPIRTDA